MKRRKLKAAEITLAKSVNFHDLRGQYEPGIDTKLWVDVEDPNDPEQTIRLVHDDRENNRDPLLWYHRIGKFDKPQWLAGETYRECLKTAQFGFSAIDTTKEAVDGGKIYEPISDRQLWASKRLTRCNIEWRNWGNRINEDTIFIMESFLLQLWFPGKIAAALGRYGERSTSEMTGRIRDGLQTAAFVFTNCS